MTEKGKLVAALLPKYRTEMVRMWGAPPD